MPLAGLKARATPGRRLLPRDARQLLATARQLSGIGIAKVASMIAEQHAWERAEVARSAAEALHTPDARLVADEANLARYLDPPIHTVYPLEYAYALLGDIHGRTVLDFGCGSGETTLLLARRGGEGLGGEVPRDACGAAGA